MDVQELTYDVPGAEELEVTLENGVLSIPESAVTRARVNTREFTTWSAPTAPARRFSLPEAAADDDVQARVDKGVLKLQIRKRE